MKLSDKTQTVFVKYIRDQFYLSLGLIFTSIYANMNQTEILSNLSPEGLANMNAGFWTGVDLIWATVVPTMFISARRLLRKEEETEVTETIEQDRNLPDHLNT